MEFSRQAYWKVYPINRIAPRLQLSIENMPSHLGLRCKMEKNFLWFLGSREMEEPGRLQSIGSWRVRHDWATSLSPFTFMHWRRKWQPTPVFLPGESQGQKSLVGCSPWGPEESDMTERLHFHLSLSWIGEGNGNPLICSCLENPRDRGAWWAAIYGVTQSRTRLKWVVSSSSREAENQTSYWGVRALGPAVSIS